MKITYSTPEQIYDADGGVVTLGDDNLRRILAFALSKIPADVADQVLDECRFFGVPNSQLGLHFPAEMVDGKAVIALADDFFQLDLTSQAGVLLHEVAHHVLGHTTGLVSWDHDVADSDRQEVEAEELKEKWLAEWQLANEV